MQMCCKLLGSRVRCISALKGALHCWPRQRPMHIMSPPNYMTSHVLTLA